MRYISDVYALNLTTNHDTCGDWHCAALDWNQPTTRDSQSSFFGTYGLELCSKVPLHPGTHVAANHVRALLDMLHDGQFSYAQGMKNDFICNDQLTPEVFNKVYELKKIDRWPDICRFMGKEYGLQWIRYLESCHDIQSVQHCHTKVEDL